jgi:hypothetical protein
LLAADVSSICSGNRQESLMKLTKRCGECGGVNIRSTTVSAGGGYAPDLLPGAHPWWKSGTLEVFICATCGLFQLFVPTASLQSVVESPEFKTR